MMNLPFWKPQAWPDFQDAVNRNKWKFPVVDKKLQCVGTAHTTSFYEVSDFPGVQREFEHVNELDPSLAQRKCL